MKTLALVWATWIAWIPVTFFFGRLFCRYVCPVGLSQSLVNILFHPKSHVRRVCARLPRSNVQHTVNVAVLLVYFTLPVGCVLHPWGIFGRVIFCFLPGIVFFAAILVTAAFGRGRFWCNWVCPLGTMFDFVAKIGWNREKVGRGCAHCRECFRKETGREGEVRMGTGVTRREALQGVATLAVAEVAEKTTDGGFAPVSLPGRAADCDLGRPVPPGAFSRERFNRLCVGCGLCLAKCPGECLRPSVSLMSLGRPVMDFSKGYCRLNCTACGDACPTGAIARLLKRDRPHVHMGLAKWHRATCVRTTNGDSCTACLRKCPVRAISLVEGFPVVDDRLCIGCGACEHVCPARPSAIVVEGFGVHREVRPVAREDLLAEMRRLFDEGATLVVARQGVIVRVSNGRGIAPLLAAMDAGLLGGAIVMDRAIGRAAAGICANAFAAEVITPLAAEGAAGLIALSGGRLRAEKTVATILNREKTDSCPMEKAVAGEENPEKMVAKIRQTLKALREKNSEEAK